MALKPIGIEDDNTFPGRVGAAITKYAQDANATALAGKASTAQAVPTGGTANQVLAKNSTANYDTKWVDPPTGGTSSTVNTPFAVRYTGTDWEFTTLAAAQAAGLNPAQTVWFIGNPGGSMPTWARAGDVWSQG